MATRFQVKRSSVSGVTPTTSDIQPGELAINLADKKLFTANSSTVFELGSNLTNLSVSSNLTVKGIIANGSLGTSGHVLHSNGTATYWAADDQGVTSVATGNGLTGGTITSTGTISVRANTGIIANATGLYVNSTYIETLSANNASFLGGTAAASYQLNSTLSANVATLASNSATYANGSITNTFTVGTGTYFVSNGNVGIGTTTPTSKLDISGSITVPTEMDYLAASLTRPDIRPSLNLDFALAKKLDPRITFSRASEGRYYDGKTTAKAEENLLLQSQDFATTWSNVNTTETVDTSVAPDGTTTADTITGSAGTALKGMQQSITLSGTYTYSVFVKAGTHNFAQLLFGGSSSLYANFDLSAGTAGSTNGTSSITSVGNNWYRCILTGDFSGATSVYIALIDSSSEARAASTASTGTLLVWGAQLEQRSAATAYTPTTTQPITNYVPQLLTAASGVARFDHDPVTCESLGLLIEEQRTNLLLQSEDFATTWGIIGTSSISTNQVIAPDGTLTADKFVLGNTIVSGSAAIFQSATKPASSATYTASVYAKAGEFNSIRLILRDSASASNFVQAYFNLATGSIATSTNDGGTFTFVNSTITEVGNGWFRVSVTGTTSTETSISVRVLNYQNGTGTATGDGYSGIYIWGAQLEAGAFPTSYIPTTASQVTRSADAASMTGTNFSSWYRQDEGTIYSESSIFSNASDITLLAIDDGETTQANQIDVRSTSGTTYRARVRLNSTTVVEMISDTILVGSTNKLAFGYKTDDHAFSFNVQTILTDGSGTVPSTPLVRMRIGVRGNQNNPLSGTIKKIAYYPKRLTDAQLQALTK